MCQNCRPTMNVNTLCIGYNEPNQKEQANLTPEEAAHAWMDLQVFDYFKILHMI